MWLRAALLLVASSCAPRPTAERAPAPLPAASAPPAAPTSTVVRAAGDVQVELGDGSGGDWGSQFDDLAWSLRLPIQRCYAAALREAPGARGWLTGEMQLGAETSPLHITASEGLPPGLVACVTSSCANVPVGNRAAFLASMTVKVYASLR